MWKSEITVFKAEETGSTKVLRWEWTWHVLGKKAASSWKLPSRKKSNMK